MSRAGSGSVPRRKAEEEPIDLDEIDDVEEEDDDDDDDDDDGEEYEVESILDSKLEKGSYKYLVKWKGYGPEHNTWEPEEHVKHAQEILQAYWDKKPKVAQVTKRKSTAADEPPAKRGRGRPPTGRTSKAAAAAKEESPDEVYYADTHRDTVDKYKDIASWEDLVKTVDTVERNHHNELSVYITMSSGERSCTTNTVANKRFPQHMLRFYESHLKWRSKEE